MSVVPRSLAPARLVARAAARLDRPPRGADPAALRRAVDGKVVVVTGASHGIGRSLAGSLAAVGARTVLLARSADALRELAASLGPRAHAVPCDLTDPAAIDDAVAEIVATHGTVDVVVSNAGKSIRRPISDSYDRLHDFTRLTAVNYLGPVQLLLGLLPAMRARGAGHVVNVSTVGVLLPPAPRWAGYVASKAAFDVWLRSVAAETADDGVTVSSVYLGLVHTRMSAPTGDFGSVRGLTADEAAGVVGRAVVERPVVVAPRWARAASVAGEVARGPAAHAMRRYGRSVDDAGGDAS